MCGIVAIQTPDRESIGRLLAVGQTAMRHRGPDDSGAYVAKRSGVGLASVRLAIMDPAGGRQPVSNETKTVHAVVNGEFYECDRLRSDLENAGHVFGTRSDSELLVHLYEEYGTDCLHHLRGEFAFVLWDEVNQRLFAACDRFGIKPLHFARLGPAWLFASEVKALLAMNLPARWNHRSLHHALAHQYLRPGDTLFAGVRQIQPAQALVLEGERCKEWVYWKPELEPDPHISPGDIACLLREAVRIRMRSDVPIACTLSGGLDSSTVAALAGVRDCFCVRFDEPGYDEGPQVLADASGAIRVHEVTVSRRDVVRNLEAAVRQCEGLAINGQLVGKYCLSRAIRDAGFKVVLAGEGADEAVLGYAHLLQDYSGQAPDAPLQRGVMLPTSAEAALWSIPAWLQRLPTFLQAKLATGGHAIALFSPPPGRQQLLDDLLEDFRDLDGPFVRQAAWMWTRTALSGYILRTLGDAAEMAHSVEARLPFLDHRLFELALKIPAASLLSAGSTKTLLREAVRGVVPEAVRIRPKHPFLAPPLEGEGEIDDFIHDTLASHACRELPAVDHAAVCQWAAKRARLPVADRRRLDPVLMQLLTATLLQQCYRLT